MGTGFGVTVNINSLNLNDQLSPKLATIVKNSLQDSLIAIKSRWQQEVQQKLKSSRAAYLQGIVIDINGYTGTVQLQDQFSKMLESGFSAFDMKVKFGKSPKAHRTKAGGWYLTIPFRHTTPNSTGTYGSKLSRDIYNIAKKLPDRGSLSFPGVGDKSWTGYQHKSTKYDGLTRIIKGYQNSNKSQYYTFRRVSNNSDPMSWWHPGYKGVKIVPTLSTFAQNTFIDLLTNKLNGII